MSNTDSQEELQQEVETEANVFETFDKADEEQVERELQGAVAEEMVYSFPQGGQTIRGLSATGIKAAVQAFNKTRKQKKLPELVINPVHNKFVVQDGIVFCESTAVMGDETWTGSANQPLKTTNRAGQTNIDPFATPKARTKAQRNALRGMLPDSLIQKLIEKWSRQQKVRTFLRSTPQNVPSEMNCEQCGDPLTLKSRQYYAQNPSKPKLCWKCNQKNI